MLDELEKENKPRENFPTADTIIRIYSRCINNMMEGGYHAACEGIIDGFHKECTEILRRYDKEKKIKNYMDYDDLLYWTVYILENFGNIRNSLNRAYQFVMCDEYQDTNIIQDRILELLTRDGDNLVVVGDDNQSIYRFRGACIRNILSFPERHKRCRVIKLIENYRSTQEILDVSNAVMMHAKTGYQKTLKGQKNGGRTKFCTFHTPTDTAIAVMDMVQEKHRGGLPYKDMAVIIRSSRQSVQLEGMLQKEGIPYQKFGGVGFFQKKTVQDVLSFIRAAFNEKDELAWIRLLQLYSGIGSVAAGKIAESFSKNGIDILTCSMEFWNDKKYETLMGIHDFIRKLQALDIIDQIKEVLVHYYDLQSNRIARKKSRSASKKEEEMLALKSGVEEAKMLLDIVDGYHTAKDFLEDVVFNAPKPKKEGDYLNITTIHSAKGLEYDTVILLGPSDRVYHRNDESKEDCEETLRCLYVALTRAKNSMYLVIEEISPGYGYQEEYVNYITRELSHDNVLRTMDCDHTVYDMVFTRERTEMEEWGFR